MSAQVKAETAWGAVPDWVQALAAECDRTSQNQTARRLERSPSLVSYVLANRYTGDMDAVEDVVRGVLMTRTVPCPVLGDLPSHVCRKWRGRSRRFQNVNSQYVTMYRACNRCPVNRDTPEEDADDHS